MTLRPLNDRVLVQPEDPPTETASGLVVVQDHQPEQAGTIIALGPLCRGDAKVGDLVAFSAAVGQEVYLDLTDGTPQRYFLMRECDLSAVVETP